MGIKIRVLEVVISIYRSTSISQTRLTPGTRVTTNHAESLLVARFWLHIPRCGWPEAFVHRRRKEKTYPKRLPCVYPPESMHKSSLEFVNLIVG